MSDSEEHLSNPIDKLSRIVNLVSGDGSSGLLEKLESISAKYELLNDEEKVEFQNYVKEKVTGEMLKRTLGSMGGERALGLFDNARYFLLAGFLLFAIIFVFFGYKLFKSLRDREAKREEKRRQRQLRKKK